MNDVLDNCSCRQYNSKVKVNSIRYETDDVTNLNEHQYHRATGKSVVNLDCDNVMHGQGILNDDHNYNFNFVLNMFSVNVCGLESRLIADEFMDQCSTHDICFFQEVKTDLTDEQYLIDQFSINNLVIKFKHRNALATTRSGGVAIVFPVSNENNFNFLNGITNDALWFTYNVCVGVQVLFCNVYVAPDGSRFHREDVFELLDNDMLSLRSEDLTYVCLVGDFNARTGNEVDFLCNNEDLVRHLNIDESAIADVLSIDENMNVLNVQQHRKSLDVCVNANGKKLIEYCKNHNVLICNGRVGADKHIGDLTCKGASVVDYFMMSPDMISKVYMYDVLAFNNLFSDCHRAIECTCRFAGNNNVTSHVTDINPESVSTGSTLKVSWDNDKADMLLSCTNLEYISFLHDSLDVMEVDTVLGLFNEDMISNYNACGLIKTVRPISDKNKLSKKWFDAECKRMRKKYYKLKNSLNRQSNPDKVHEFKECSREYRQTLRNAKSVYVNQTRVQLRDSNPKQFWKILQNHKSVTNSIPMSELHEHFENLNVVHDDNIVEDIPIMNNAVDVNILDDPITVLEVLTAITKLKNGKATGIDLVSNEFLKLTGKQYAIFYCKLFNIVMESGNFPEAWADGLIVPIYKGKGDVNNVNNYRGITLLSCLGKLFSNILRCRLEKFASVNTIIRQNQAGFRRNHSTIDHIFTLKCLIDVILYRKQTLYVAFADFSKAFDSIWRNGLWFKMVNSGVSAKVVNIIRSMYANAKAKVFCNGNKSMSFTSFAGVRQGEPLSGFLYALFINDLEEFLAEYDYDPICIPYDNAEAFLILLILLYADDGSLVSCCPVNLQLGLDILKRYCNKWKLKVNTSKTVVTIFSRKVTDDVKFFYDGVELSICKSFKYLGVPFSYNGSFKDCIIYLRDQGQKAMFGLIGKCRRMKIPLAIQIDLFSKLIIPIITYGCEVWGYENTKILDKLQLKYLRYILKLKQGTPIPMIYGETGVLPVSVIIKSRMVNFYMRLIRPGSDNLSATMYKCIYDMYLYTDFKSLWFRMIESIFISVGEHGMFVLQTYSEDDAFKLSIKSRLKDVFISEWFGRLGVLSKCDVYRRFKTSFGKELYIDKLCDDLIIALCKFRTCNHKLEIELMRYGQFTPRDQRFCTRCDRHELSSEFHHVLQCSINEDLRQRFMNRKYLLNPVESSFITLMCSSNISELKRLAIFIAHSAKLL